MAISACNNKDLTEKVKFDIKLDKSNTYVAGKPVKFNISGNVDNLLFYSGDIGSQYKYKDRNVVPIDKVNSAKLELNILSQFGMPGALDVYISNKFDGLSGNDAAADKKKITEMEKGGMKDWNKLQFNEKTGKWSTHSIDLNDYIENFSLAIHWHPKRDGKNAQRTYSVKGNIVLDMEGAAPAKLKLSNLGLVAVMMNNEIEKPYKVNAGVGSVLFNQPEQADFIFKGVGPKQLPYALDGWVISTPSPLNRVPNDKGIVVKNMQNYLSSFEYIYKNPGTYKVTVIGTNCNYQASSREVKEFEVKIVPKQ